jgi:hypothetical protein
MKKSLKKENFIDFPQYKNIEYQEFESKEIQWNAFPQRKEDYKKVLKSFRNI